MQTSNGICDDMLAAFADGLLDEANSEAVITAIENDPDTRERYHRLRHAKDLMKLGFGKARAPGRSFWRDSFPKAAAAIAVIAVSIGTGDLLHHF
jgi:anti-sigma factor RsiW